MANAALREVQEADDRDLARSFPHALGVGGSEASGNSGPRPRGGRSWTDGAARLRRVNFAGAMGSGTAGVGGARAGVAEVFVSYSRKDQPVAEAIAAALGALGFEVWWDRDLLGGEDYRKKTAKIIAKVPAAIVLWSRRSIDSEWVVGEAAAARERRILVPVAIDGVEAPIDFRSLNTIDLAGWIPGDPLPDMLVKAVCEKTGRAFSAGAAANASAGGFDKFSRLVARSWYADFECLLFSFIAQGFASVLTNAPLAVHHAAVPVPIALAIAASTSTITAAVIMRPALADKRLPVALGWFAVAVATGVVGYLLTSVLWRTLSVAEFMTFVGFWALGLVLVLDVARRAASAR